ncbi:hypothetical protein CU633_01900 [Bacillus sp. V3-13]|uniref:hypothetical protein n=1 Tax=Bacillus sp. V3-13 TaxID=2053728 RepID=UPI000C756706|nr:hypothetical protein [Bacillus sp. V3-13]PLR79144.1 hypothetical protein CU633_01900 [Bacillus sp. V3-13]
MTLDRSTLNLDHYRSQKQAQAEKSVQHLLRLAGDYTERNTNIREKVRAKHIFRKKLGLRNGHILTAVEEELFEQWFLFDYQTIQGFTMLSLFLKNQASNLTEPEMIQGALFLSSVLEPFTVISVDEGNDELTVQDFSSEMTFPVFSKLHPLQSQNLQYVFIRKIPALKRDIAISPLFAVNGPEVFTKLENSFIEQKCEDASLSWRTFLKKNAILFLYEGLRKQIYRKEI